MKTLIGGVILWTLCALANAQCISVNGHIFSAGGVPVCAQQGPTGEPLLEPDNITYVGYFIVPAGTGGTDATEFHYTKGGMGATSAGGAPGTGALYLTNVDGKIGAINIPSAADIAAGGTTATINTPLSTLALSGGPGSITALTNDLPGENGGTGNWFTGTGSVTTGSTTLTITAVGSGTLPAGAQINGPGVPFGDEITYETGSGGVGTYTLSEAAIATSTGTYQYSATTPIYGGIIPRADGNLDVTYYWYYPGGPCCTKNALILSGDLSHIVSIDQQLGTGSDPSQFAGLIGTIGTEWQSVVGGAYITGQGSLVANDIRGVVGASTFVFNPDFSASSSSINLTALTHYPYTPASENIVPNWNRPTIGTSDYISANDQGAGAAIPTGFSTLMTFGVHGVGPYCYGSPTSDQSLQRTAVPGDAGVIYCYDLGTQLTGPSDKGVHSYPYEWWVELWKMSDVEQVISGALQPYQIYPYAAFQLPWPVGGGKTPGDADAISGAGYYDQSSGYLYIMGSTTSPEEIFVWKISKATTTPCQIETTALPGATNGSAYSTTLAATSGCAAPVSWKLLYENPSYMSDLSMTADGVLSSPSITDAAGTYDVMVEAADANGKDAMIGLPMVVN